MKEINLKAEYSKRLIALEQNLTAQDKLDAMDSLNLSRPTIDKYLTGDAPKIEVAHKLIEFFTDRVQERINSLREAVII